MDDGSTAALTHKSVILPLRDSSSRSFSYWARELGVVRMDLDVRLGGQHPQNENAHQAKDDGPRLVEEHIQFGASSGLARYQKSEANVETWGERREKRPKMELPPLLNLGAVNLCSATTPTKELFNYECAPNPWALAHPRPHHSYSWPPSSPTNSIPTSNHLGGLAPLTPPQEADSFKWYCLESSSLARPPDQSLSTEQQNSRPDISSQQQSSATLRPTTISLPGFVNSMSEQGSSPSTWLERAVDTIASCHATDLDNLSQTLVVVQALPSQKKNPATKPVFQEIVETIQQRSNKTLYMTITHAVPQIVSMEEVPASPPATPNNQQENDDYFDNHTMYTHASPIPMYHGPLQPPSSGGVKANGLVTAPSSIQISTLERYIPPSTAQEADDFWWLSRRSYLIDRMTELSVAGGTLLLIYPTQVGGAVFARQYIGPILDPFLRQFVLLNNLTTDIAATLGKFAAVPHMKTFEEMEEGLKTLCRELTPRAPGRGLRGEFKVIHAEKAEVILDRTTWLSWFIEQESGRLRQNIVDYQKAGGRMPTRGFDASPSSLAREVIEGIKNSREEAGGVGIEVGVFVVRRSAL